MEVKEIADFFRKRIKNIIMAGMLFGLAGLALNYVLPPKYYSTGSLYIRRTIYPYSEDHFTYEGYYSQQAAMFYTNSVIGLIQSEDIRAQSLNDLNIKVNEKTLRQYDRKIRTAKNGPQLVTLIIKEDSSEKSELLWQAVSNATIKTMDQINQRGDPFVNVVKITEKPIIKESYREAWVFASVGTFLGTVIATSFYILKIYFGNHKRR